MLKINNLSYDKLKNAEHVSLFTNVKVAIDKLTPTSLGLSETLFTAYKSALGLEQDIVNRSMASVYTPEMEEADKERDRLFRLIRSKLETVTHAKPGSEKAGYLTIVKRDLLNKYGNDVCLLPYQEESAVIAGFILDAYNFLGDDAIETLDLTDDVEALDQANKAFADMYNERVTEKAGASTEKTKELRKATEEQFNRIVCHIEYKVNTDESSLDAVTCKSILGIINQIIADAQTRLNTRLGKTSGSADGEDSDIEAPVFK